MIKKSYARVGPEASQRLVTFDNGTCLSFGPDVSASIFSTIFNRSTFLSDSSIGVSESGSPKPGRLALRITQTSCVIQIY